MESYIWFIWGATGNGQMEEYNGNKEGGISMWTIRMNVDVMMELVGEIATFITSLLYRQANEVETLYFLVILKVDKLGVIHSMFIVDTV